MDYDIQQNLEENGGTHNLPVKLSVDHILGALFLLLFGNAFATVSFLVEILLNYCCNNKLTVRYPKSES